MITGVFDDQHQTFIFASSITAFDEHFRLFPAKFVGGAAKPGISRMFLEAYNNWKRFAYQAGKILECIWFRMTLIRVEFVGNCNANERCGQQYRDHGSLYIFSYQGTYHFSSGILPDRCSSALGHPSNDRTIIPVMCDSVNSHGTRPQ